jgi:hypothetical protein
MPRVGFEPTTSVFEREKTFLASDRMTTEICKTILLYIFMFTFIGNLGISTGLFSGFQAKMLYEIHLAILKMNSEASYFEIPSLLPLLQYSPEYSVLELSLSTYFPPVTHSSHFRILGAIMSAAKSSYMNSS